MSTKGGRKDDKGIPKELFDTRLPEQERSELLGYRSLLDPSFVATLFIPLSNLCQRKKRTREQGSLSKEFKELLKDELK